MGHVMKKQVSCYTYSWPSGLVIKIEGWKIVLYKTQEWNKTFSSPRVRQMFIEV